MAGCSRSLPFVLGSFPDEFHGISFFTRLVEQLHYINASGKLMKIDSSTACLVEELKKDASIHIGNHHIQPGSAFQFEIKPGNTLHRGWATNEDIADHLCQ